MRYIEVLPQPALRPFIRLIWEMEVSDIREFGPPLRIMPDGAVELVIHFGPPLTISRAGETGSVLPTGFLISQTSRYAEIFPQGATGLIAVRFHPWGAARGVSTEAKIAPDV